MSLLDRSLKSLKQRLEDSSEIRINLCANTICVKDKAPAVTSHKEPSPPKPSHSGSAVQESVTAALSASATMKCEEAPQTTPAAPAKGATANLPLIDDNTFKIITAAVREHRLTRETTTPSSDKEVKLASVCFSIFLLCIPNGEVGVVFRTFTV